MVTISNVPNDNSSLTPVSASWRHATVNPRATAPKPGESPIPSPYLARTQRQHLHGHASVLKLLAVFVVVVAVAQLLGIGGSLRHTILARCASAVHDSHDQVNIEASTGDIGTRGRGHKAGFLEHLCAKEGTILGRVAVGTAVAGASGIGGSSTNSGGSSSGGVYLADGNRAFETTAALAAASSYHPAEWPRVYGGRAEPHKRILKRCTGGLFGPPMEPSSQPGQSLVGVWLPRQFDLAFCDSEGNSVALRLRASRGAAGAGEAAAGAAAGAGGGASAASTGVSTFSSASASDVTLVSAVGSRDTTTRGGSRSDSSRDGTPSRSKSDKGGGVGRWFWRDLLSYYRRDRAASEPATDASVAAGAGAPTAEDDVVEGALGPTIDLATSRALVADGGSVRIVWVDSSTLVADGVTAALELTEGTRPRRGGRAACSAQGATHSAAATTTTTTTRSTAAAVVTCAVVSEGLGAGTGPDIDYTAADRAEIDFEGHEGDDGGGGEGGGGDGGGLDRLVAAAGSHEGRVRRMALAGTAAGKGNGEVDDVLEKTAATAPMVVLVTPLSPSRVAREGRMVLRLVEVGESVEAAVRSAVELLSSEDTFTRKLETAVVSSYEVLREVPYTIGLPRTAPGEDKRLSRKLYDIMLFNTASDWSTPDRTPHSRQWLWDSCFHALGMNLVNHTAAWKQLKGMLRCQQPDGFLPHICSRGGSSTGGDGGGKGLSGRDDQAEGSYHLAAKNEGRSSGSSRRSGGFLASELTQPPLLAWAVWDNYLFARDKRRLQWALPKIIGLLQWLARYRSRDGGLTYFYVHGFESGMDNSPRFDRMGLVGRLSGAVRRWAGDPRAGTCALCAPHLVSVDLCALVAREMALVGKMMRELGRVQEAGRWTNRSRSVTEALLANTWSSEQRMYGDVVIRGGVVSGLLLPLMGSAPPRQVSDLITVAGLLPLLAGELPTNHLNGLLEHLKDPNSFATPVPLPSVAVSSQPLSTDMWRGPMWVNINYLVAVGLREQAGGRCGECDRLADWIIRSTIEEVRKWYDGGVGDDSGEDSNHSNNKYSSGIRASIAAGRGTVFEFYDPYGKVPPTRLSRKGMEGIGGVRDYHWTAALTLRMMAEVAARDVAAAAGGGGGRSDGPRRLPEWVPTGGSEEDSA